ncbi:patatin-like phospholipase family protein [Candidatus Viridilinea mediisalina]|uniref:Patatin n=1 Tax=Candidatus Viridilinea mediisalina TaxID=2024553 RepID=A0A2A6RKC8_9CHLR|nr:patatin-like phospholipase family protein [Candidatus Viridilinea mediisalina]PDW03517.1 patatin [Candidatus Viridilinea mediisalina]
MGERKKALVLSGGGARGAYHVGVIRALVELGWMEDGRGPDLLAGTSIGAINAAALASGLRVAQLEQRWRTMHTEDVHRLSADLPLVTRPFARFLLHSILTSERRNGVTPALPRQEVGQSAWSCFTRLANLFRSRPFRSLLDTQPWRHTLAGWMDFARINSPAAPALLIAATELQTGGLEVFCNRPLRGRPATRLGIEHLMASSSIPVVYPWTEIGAGKYWDGAVLANTPLDPVIELAGEDSLEIIVVMMTPWNSDHAMQCVTGLPQDLAQALSLTLDWALLASYRVAFQAISQRNQLADAVARLQAAGLAPPAGPLPRPMALPTVIAPLEPMPLDWIIDYEHHNHEHLFALGYQDALRVLQQNVGEPSSPTSAKLFQDRPQ